MTFLAFAIIFYLSLLADFNKNVKDSEKIIKIFAKLFFLDK